ncbi:MAG: hypothetical protein K0Q53_2873 [Massilibacillus sp.]|jgi:hypothetical protein|nr:hypothetical protein [Massilibacillus sp.]
MEKYRETSEYSKEKLIWMGLAIIALIVWSVVEIKAILAGKLNLGGVVYILLFTGLLIWRYAVSYAYSLTKDELIIYSKFLGFSKTFVVAFDSVENYSDQYVKKLFRRTGISCYNYRYSSGDGKTTRILLFRCKGKKHAVLFKVSDKFMQELQKLMPEKYLDMRECH